MRHIVFFISVVFLIGCQVTDGQEIIDHLDDSFTGVETLEVKGAFCDVVVQPGHEQTVWLEGEIRGVRKVNDIKIRSHQDGSVLEVWIDHPRSIRGMIRGVLNFKVPKGVVLRIETVSGNINVEGVGREELVLKSVSGDVGVSGIPCHVEVGSVSGNVEARFIEGGVKAHSVSGSLYVENIKGVVDARSTSGNVSISMAEGALTVGTTSGDCILKDVLNTATVNSISGEVRVLRMKGDLSVKTVSGDISIDEGVGKVNLKSLSGDQSGVGLLLTGSSRFHSISGDIEMAFSNGEGAIHYRLSSQSGSLRVRDLKGERDLEVGQGPVVVTGVSASGDQSYR